MTVKATYESGVFRPLDAVSLPEHSDMEFEPRVVSPIPLPDISPEALEEIYATVRPCPLDPSSPGNLAERHNEHQP